MKKVFTFIGAASLVLALNSCNNAEETAKLTEEQNTKLQGMIDEKLKAAEDAANAACQASVDSAATIAFAAWQAEAAAAAKKGGAKPKPKPAPIAPATQDKKDKMEGGTKTVTKEDTDKKKSKMGGK